MSINATNSTGLQMNTDFINKSSEIWFLPRIMKSFGNAVELQSKAALPDRTAVLNFGYLVSPYAGACMTMAIILNRTVVFASSRRNINRLSGIPKASLRIISLAVLSKAFYDIFLQFVVITPTLKKLVGGFITDDIPSVDEFLWKVFLTLCISQFLETFVSITSNQSALNDTGLTLFEHSLAFQECQFSSVPSFQLLVICLFSLVNQFVIHILGLTNTKKYQLIPSTILGIAFLGFYVSSIFDGGIMFFPTVVIVSVIPQFLVFTIIALCLALYYLAVLVNQDSTTLTYTVMINNLKSSINLQLNDDFHSALMRFGYIMFTAVENEEYVNELSDLSLPQKTYLESNGYLISGFLNSVKSNPELARTDESKDNTNDYGLQYQNSSIFKRMMNIGILYKKLVVLLFSGKKNSNQSTLNTNNIASKQQYKHDTNLDITETNYQLYLSNDQNDSLPEIDTSEDFVYESESDIDPLDFDSDIEDIEQEIDTPSYLSSAAQARLHDAGASSSISSTPPPSSIPHSFDSQKLIKPKPIDELITSKDMIDLINPQNFEQVSFLNSLRTHMLQDSRLTRSSYSKINQDTLLGEVLLQNRLQANGNKHIHRHDEEDDDSQDLACVVCQTNNREIVVWPCKCFALCENCRISLGVRGFSICVCCRRKVDGYSKIYIP